ncbi:MAG: rod shape-determining protein MreC [Ignavibacteriales bacterium]|nr:rod shape-determining protein MreC [Ignavibacteriales bacterium]
MLLIKNIWQKYKEYIILIFLLLISLIILLSNNEAENRKISKISSGGFLIINSLSNFFQDIFSSDDELEELRRTNAELMLEVNRLREFSLEVEELREIFHYKNQDDYPLIPARIINKTVSKVNNYFTLNCGTDDGAATGMPVINHHGLIGIVEDATEKYCLVRTLQNSTLKLSVKIQRNNLDGILTWNGNNLIVKNIPVQYEVNIGDIIVTSDFSTLMPPSLPIGTVKDKEKNISGLFSDLIIQPYADFVEDNYVFLLIIKQDKNIWKNLIK